jgi:CubicO group peptidase (beta-lactamase class C family)
LLGFILEEFYGKPLDEIWRSEVAVRLGLKSSGFKPRRNKENIAPTENTRDRGLVWGDVHDEKSYYLGGVAGHAGLFSTASEIDKIVQSLLNADTIPKGVFDLATRNRNESVGGMFGLGWMTKVPVPPNRSDSFDLNGFMGDFAPYGTFGHTGFTGTSVCINPESRIVCILLTNRTYPTRENTLNIRLRRLFHNSIFLNLS